MKFDLSDFLELDTKALLAVNGGASCSGGSCSSSVSKNTGSCGSSGSSYSGRCSTTGGSSYGGSCSSCGTSGGNCSSSGGSCGSSIFMSQSKTEEMCIQNLPEKSNASKTEQILKMGGHKLTNYELFDYLVDVVEGTELMGKSYSTDPNDVYVCTTFVEEIIDILNIDKEEYLPAGQLVVNNIAQIDDLKSSDGKNPSAGTYVFYYDYGDGTGHAGFVHFDEKGNTQILHNGANGSGLHCVNLRERDSRDFETWFGNNPNGNLYYKSLEASIWEE